MEKLIVASNSPRRKELMKQAGFTFDIVSKDVNEDIPGDIDIRHSALYLARKKHRAYSEDLPDSIVLTADTTVICNGVLLEKPSSFNEAKKMLRSLSNNTNDVITGVCIGTADKTESIECTTQVFFKPLTDDEIEHYINKYSPFDKAGAYGIQEWIGLIGINSINGSYYNVMGLPIDLVYDCLVNKFGLRPF